MGQKFSESDFLPIAQGQPASGVSFDEGDIAKGIMQEIEQTGQAPSPQDTEEPQQDEFNQRFDAFLQAVSGPFGAAQKFAEFQAGATEAGITVGQDPRGAVVGAGQGIARLPGEEGDSEAQQMAREAFEDAGPIAGQLLGAMAGSATGIPGGTLAGGTIGAGAGELAQQQVARAFGGEAPADPEEAIGEVGSAAVEGLLAEMIPAATLGAANLSARIIGRIQAVPAGVVERAIARPSTASRAVGFEQRAKIEQSVVKNVQAVQSAAESARRSAGEAVAKSRDMFIKKTGGEPVVATQAAKEARDAVIKQRGVDAFTPSVLDDVAKIIDKEAVSDPTRGLLPARTKLTAEESMRAVSKIDDLVSYKKGGLQVASSDADQQLLKEVRAAIGREQTAAAARHDAIEFLNANERFIAVANAFDDLGLQLGTRNMTVDARLAVGKRIGTRLGEAGLSVANSQKNAGFLGAQSEMTALLDNVTRSILSGSSKFTPSSISLSGVRGIVPPSTIAALSKSGPKGAALARLLGTPVIVGSGAGEKIKEEVGEKVDRVKTLLTPEDSNRFFNEDDFQAE